MKQTIHYLLTIILTISVSCSQSHEKKFTQLSDVLERGFISPPDSVQTSVYWYWISDNISKEGAVKDLHAMKEAGINRAFIGNIGISDLPYGKVKIFSDEWWEILHLALKTATELDIEIGILNWDVPEGEWTILRMDMPPTQVTNGPASPEATGLEVDKMSKKWVAEHFDRFIGEILRRIPEADRKNFKVVVQNSYETGGQNFTDGFLAEFTVPDCMLPEDQRETWCFVNHYNAKSPLQPSGLFGPVTINAVKYGNITQ